MIKNLGDGVLDALTEPLSLGLQINERYMLVVRWGRGQDVGHCHAGPERGHVIGSVSGHKIAYR
jgi:hypothetical protein